MRILRQASAGLVWSKQFYPYRVGQWLDGDPAQPAPPPGHATGRNAGWRHLDAFDILAMPDPWEYPWFAAWDLAFHAVAWAHLDPAFAKYQLIVLLREWFLHPNGALPAYEWNFDDVNPPVHAIAAVRVFLIDGGTDTDFLERVFQKLLLNFTWWLNRQDPDGNNIFGGGFLGLDNISPIDRSSLPPGVRLAQADGTAWMALYALSMLVIARRLAEANPVYEDMVVKFVEQYLMIVEAIEDTGLHDQDDGWFYDRLEAPEGATPDPGPDPRRRHPAAPGRRPAGRATRRPPAGSGTASTASLRRAATGAAVPARPLQRGRETGSCCPWSARRSCGARWPPCSTRPRSSRRTGSARSRSATRCRTRSPATRRRGSSTSPARVAPTCTGATPTGGARSGCRSTS